MGGSSVVDVKCQGQGPNCPGTFSYKKKSNVTRKYCDLCAAERIKISKLKSLKAQRDERQHERLAAAKLKLIPDYLESPTRMLDREVRAMRS